MIVELVSTVTEQILIKSWIDTPAAAAFYFSFVSHFPVWWSQAETKSIWKQDEKTLNLFHLVELVILNNPWNNGCHSFQKKTQLSRVLAQHPWTDWFILTHTNNRVWLIIRSCFSVFLERVALHNWRNIFDWDEGPLGSYFKFSAGCHYSFYFKGNSSRIRRMTVNFFFLIRVLSAHVIHVRVMVESIASSSRQGSLPKAPPIWSIRITMRSLRLNDP